MHRRRLTVGIVSALLTVLCAPTATLAAENSYVPEAGGFWSTAGNWSLGHCPTSGEDVSIIVSGTANKAVDYDWTGASSFNLMTIDGGGSFYGAIWQLENTIIADRMDIGYDGEAWHWMEGNALLWLSDMLVVGYVDPGPGHFYLNTETNGLVSGSSLIGSQGPGDFEHLNGGHATERLRVGGTGGGTYWFSGPEDTSILSASEYAHVGEYGVGLFEQTGGTFNCEWFGLMLGFGNGSEGTYNMKGGVLNTTDISVGWMGDGYFTQSGGVVNVDTDITIGDSQPQPNRASYVLNEDDGPAELNIGTDLRVGEFALAKYEQTAGTATVTGNLEIWQGTTGSEKSYVYLGSTAGLLGVQGDVTNHSGYYDQDGGVMTTPSFTNDSSFGFNLDYDADFRATTLVHNAGTLYMWRNAMIRGELFMPPSTFYMCNFTNNSNVQMGNASFNGGTFIGHMTNNGSFNYTQGDFSASMLTNYGTVNLNAPFTCNRLVQNAYSFVVTTTTPITATGTGYANAFESNGNLTIHDGATITVVAAPLVSNEAMYAGGTVIGDVENNDYLLPAIGSDTDEFYIDGDFTQSSTGMLRVRLSGTWPITEFDRLRLTGHATLGGTLQVLLIDGFTPALGDSFRVVIHSGGHTGEFDTESLPALPDGLAWEVNYYSGMVQLDVVEEIECPGDLDGDLDVDLSDLAQLLGNYGMTSGAQYEDGDLDGDGDVDLSDLAELLGLYGTTC